MHADFFSRIYFFKEIQNISVIYVERNEISNSHLVFLTQDMISNGTRQRMEVIKTGDPIFGLEIN